MLDMLIGYSSIQIRILSSSLLLFLLQKDLFLSKFKCECFIASVMIGLLSSSKWRFPGNAEQFGEEAQSGGEEQSGEAEEKARGISL